MKTKFGYVDGFVLPVKKNKINSYKKLATIAGKVWMDHGAIDYVECIADNVPHGKRTSFPRSVKLKKSEVVFFSWITYKSKSHRDSVMKKVMKDPRLKMDDKAMKNIPFDMKRMFWGGFKPLVRI